MDYSFIKNLKLKKYYKEPNNSYNIVSVVIFRLEQNYKSMYEYYDKFIYMIKQFKYYFNNYYLRIYFDKSIYIKTKNNIINDEIDKMWIPLLKNLKKLSFVQLVEFNHMDFKYDKVFHKGLFPTMIRFIPMFDYDNNHNIKTIIISDIDINKSHLEYIKRCSEYVNNNKLKFFFRTSFCSFIRGRNYMAQDIANTWLRVMAGTIICNNHKFSHIILDDFFYQLKYDKYDKNLLKFINMDIYNHVSHKASDEKIYKYGIDEFFLMYLIKDLIEKNIKFGYLSTKGVDTPIWFLFESSNKFTDNKYDYKKLMKDILKEYYDDNKTLTQNYEYLIQILNIIYTKGKQTTIQSNIIKYYYDFIQSLYDFNSYSDYGLTLDGIKCILYQKNKTNDLYIYNLKTDDYKYVFDK